MQCHQRICEKIHCQICFWYSCWHYKISINTNVFPRACADYLSVHPQCTCNWLTMGSHLNPLAWHVPSCTQKQNPSEIPMCPHAPCQKWLVSISCLLDKTPLGIGKQWNMTCIKLSFETKITNLHSLYNFFTNVLTKHLSFRQSFSKNWWKSSFIS